MREQLKLLEDLQLVDAKLHETEQALSSLPEKLQSLKKDVGSVEKMLEAERQQLAEVQKYKAEKEQSAKSEQDRMNKSKSKLSTVKSSKEYMAIQREIEVNRKNLGERDEEMLKLMEAVEKFQQSITTHESELKVLKDHVDAEERETQEKMAELEKIYEVQRRDRNKMAEAIRKDVYAKYDAIRKRRGNAVVPVKDGVCTGCHMQVPPQLFNILQVGDSIEYCPACKRIIFFEHPPALPTE